MIYAKQNLVDVLASVARRSDETITPAFYRELQSNPFVLKEMQDALHGQPLPLWRSIVESRPAIADTPHLISSHAELEEAWVWLSKTARESTRKRLYLEELKADPHSRSITEWVARTGFSHSTIQKYRRHPPSTGRVPAHYRTALAREAILKDPYAMSIKDFAAHYNVSPAFVSLVRKDARNENP